MVKKSSANPLIPVMVLFSVVLIMFGLSLYVFETVPAPTQIPNKNSLAHSGKMIPFNFDAQTFTLDDQTWEFSNGAAVNADATDKAIIGERTLNTQGNKAAAIITDEPGGSGIFFYVVGASQTDSGEVYSKPVLLGDRIKYESLAVSDDGIIEVTYFDRNPKDPMTIEPSVKKTSKFAFQDDGNLISVLN